MDRIKRLRSSMSFNIIGAIVFVLVLFGVIVSTVGYASFTEAFKKEYSTTTYHIAATAATFVNGDHLDEYLAEQEKTEYLQTKRILERYCKRMNVSMIYVIMVDRSDYGRFVSIFNPVENSVDDSSYTEWELGHKRNTTNNEYRQKYKAIYDKEAVFETVYRIRTTDGQHPHITTMVPVMDSEGEVAGILCVQRPIRELHEARRPYLFTIAISTVLLSLFASAFAAMFIRKQFVNPVKKVSAEAGRFAKENTIGEPLGAISRFKELSELSLSIDTMEADMVKYIKHLTAATAERERIGTELSLARKIQEGTVPSDFPIFPDRTEFDIYATMDPAKEVGGDFYNFHLIDDDHLALFIGDVSGKGIPGALFMMVTNILILNGTRIYGKPSEVISFVNNVLCKHNKAEMFVTMWLGILEISTGKVIAVNAGHEDLAICRKDEAFELFRTKHDFVMGGMENVPYHDYEFSLEKGDKLFIYTDGLPEATNKDNKMFTTAKMVDALNKCKDGSPKEILEAVQKSVDEFVGEAPQFDDLTMFCIEIKKPEEA